MMAEISAFRSISTTPNTASPSVPNLAQQPVGRWGFHRPAPIPLRPARRSRVGRWPVRQNAPPHRLCQLRRIRNWKAPMSARQFLSKAIESRFELTQNDRGGWRGASGIQYTDPRFRSDRRRSICPANTRRTSSGCSRLQEFSISAIWMPRSHVRFDHARLEAQTLGITRKFNNVSAALGVGYTYRRPEIRDQYLAHRACAFGRGTLFGRAACRHPIL